MFIVVVYPFVVREAELKRFGDAADDAHKARLGREEALADLLREALGMEN